MCSEITYSTYVYNDLALNDLQCLACHKTKPNQTERFIMFETGTKKDLFKIDGQ